MTYQMITDRTECRAAFDQVREAFRKDSATFSDHMVGWQSGSGRFDVSWHDALGVWGLFEPSPPLAKNPARFWIAFGVTDPATRATLHITVEMNPPHEGINRRTGGVFLKDSLGRFYLGHTGKVGGGRPGIGPAAFRDLYPQGDWQEVERHGGRPRLAIPFGPIGETRLCPMLADYVHTVARFKERVAGRDRGPR